MSHDSRGTGVGRIHLQARQTPATITRHVSNGKQQLESNAIGMLATAALTAAYLAPALSIYALFGPMVDQVGMAVGFVVFVGVLMTLPSAVSFGVLTREMPSAGGVYAWSSAALGPSVGLFAGVTTAFYYVLTVFFPPILFGQFFSDLLGTMGFHPSTWTLLAGAAIALTLNAWVTYRGILISSRLAFVMLMTELTVVVALGLTFLVLAVPHGLFSWAPVLPQAAKHGWSGIILALPMAMLAMTCDAATPASEETRNARHIIPLTMVVTTALIGLWYVIGFSAFAMAAPPDRIFALAADADATPILPLARDAWGPFSVLVTITGMTAATGALVAGSTAASRVLFAMGRGGVLPPWLGTVHTKFKAPWPALHVVYGISVVAVVSVMLIVGANQTFTWWSNVFAWYIAVAYFFANLANIVYHWRFARERFSLLLNLIIPAIGLIAQLFVVWQLVIVEMWKQHTFGRTGQAFILLGTLATILYVAWMRRRNRALD